MHSFWRLTPERFATRVKWLAIVGAVLFVAGPAWLLLLAAIFALGSLGRLVFVTPLLAIPLSFALYRTGYVRLRRRDPAARVHLTGAVLLNWNVIVLTTAELAPAAFAAVATGEKAGTDAVIMIALGICCAYHVLANAYVLASTWLRVEWPDVARAIGGTGAANERWGA